MSKKIAMQKIVLFESDSYDFDEVKKDLEEANEREFSDRMVWEVMGEYETEDWNEFLGYLRTINAPYGWLIMGNNRTWCRSCYGYKKVDNLENALYNLGESFEIWTENGHLHIRAYHHDGGCAVEAKVITAKGNELYENLSWTENEYDIFDKMSAFNLFTKLPHLEKAIGY